MIYPTTPTDKSAATSVGATVAAVSAAGTVYAPGDTITLAGGTLAVTPGAAATALTVATTKVVSATIAAAGSGGVDGSKTVTGTTGTGTKFQATVTVAGGVITSVDAIAVAGSYTGNPTAIATEPVTGASLVGAQLAVVMGAATATIATAGAYTAAPSNAVAQGSTSGSGSGSTWTMTYAVVATNAIAKNARRKGFGVYNPLSAGESLYISFLGTASTSTIELAPGQEYEKALGIVPNSAISVYAATVAHAFVAWEYD